MWAKLETYFLLSRDTGLLDGREIIFRVAQGADAQGKASPGACLHSDQASLSGLYLRNSWIVRVQSAHGVNPHIFQLGEQTTRKGLQGQKRGIWNLISLFLAQNHSLYFSYFHFPSLCLLTNLLESVFLLGLLFLYEFLLLNSHI